MQGNHTAGLRGRALGDAVIDHVLTFPDEHDQSSTAFDFDPDGYPVYPEVSAPVCGTTACIGGWAVALHYGVRGQKAIWAQTYNKGRPAADVAAELLGLDRDLFLTAVFQTMDRDQAISNLKHLLDETYSELAS